AQSPQDNPPAYEYVPERQDYDKGKLQPKPQASSEQPLIPYSVSGPSYTTQPTYTPAPTVYHYKNPATGEHVASLLPPNHPEMVCLQSGMHVPETRYSFLGLLAAIVWFPLGIGLCLLDRRIKCTRCGHMISDGVCS
ncbi:hypothetical protein BDQ12DRAFT_672547, partial [Crucibulum laeve]